MRHSGRSRGHPIAGPVVRCAKPWLAPIYTPRLQINAKFNTTTISRVALATVDAIKIADIDVYRFPYEGYAGNDMRYSVQEAGELIEGKLYGRPDN